MNQKLILPLTIKKPEPKVQHDICPIDLHIRSNYSDDGYYDVEEIFKQAKQFKNGSDFYY